MFTPLQPLPPSVHPPFLSSSYPFPPSFSISLFPSSSSSPQSCCFTSSALDSQLAPGPLCICPTSPTAVSTLPGMPSPCEAWLHSHLGVSRCVSAPSILKPFLQVPSTSQVRSRATRQVLCKHFFRGISTHSWQSPSSPASTDCPLTQSTEGHSGGLASGEFLTPWSTQSREEMSHKRVITHRMA